MGEKSSRERKEGGRSKRKLGDFGSKDEEFRAGKEKKKEGEEQKITVITRGVVRKEKVEGLREEVEEIVRTTGAVAKVGRSRKIECRERKGGGIVWVRFANVAEKLKVMKGKKKLWERREWIANDLTEKEKRTEWLIKREAERKGKE